MECPFLIVYRLICFLHAFLACHFARHVSFRQPRRLSPRFPRRFLADYPSPRLPAVRADFITFVPRSFRLLGTPIAPPKRCRSCQNQFSSADCTAHVYRLRPQHHLTSLRRITTSISHRRPDIASARLSRRMAPRRAGRVSITCPFGAARHGSRWRPTDMPDAIQDARSRRSSGQRIPDTDIEVREAGEMRYACRDIGQLRYRVH